MQAQIDIYNCENMKRKSLALIFFILMLLVIAFILINYSNLMPSPNTQGAHDAYFTKVEYQATTYQHTNDTWSLIIYNKNCTTSGEGNASFFLIFYLDDDLWWNEYNDTDYKTWECNKEEMVICRYTVPSWNTIKPVVHYVKAELYWYNRNASLIQDVVSFTISVVIHVETSNLMIFSYLTVYLIAIFFLGFYMLTMGTTKISSASQNAKFIFNQQSNRMVSFLPKVCRQRFLCFYLFVFASWQMINALFYAFPHLEQLRQSLYLMIQIAYIFLLVLVIRTENSNFGGYGYLWPEETNKYIFGSLLLAVFYSFVTIFLPGSFTGYDVFPSPSFTEVFLVILLALVASFTSETIFRGYLQSNLTKISGFTLALLTTSTMFALYRVPLLPFHPSHFLYEILSFFVVGILLGILFHRTKTLLYPVIFYFTILTLKSLTPVKAATTEYTELFLELVALTLSLLLLSVLTVKKE